MSTFMLLMALSCPVILAIGWWAMRVRLKREERLWEQFGSASAERCTGMF